MKNKNRTSKIFQIALFVLSVGMLAYFCISGNNLVILLHTLPSLHLFWLLGAGCCVAANWWIDSLVLHNLVSQAYRMAYSYKNAFRVTMVGQYFNSVSPYAAAGQPMQLLALTRQGISSGVALSVLVRKFLVYQTVITLYSLAVIIVKYNFFRNVIPGFMALAFVGFLCQAGVVVLLFIFSHNRLITTKLIHGLMWVLKKVHLVKHPEETGQKVQDQLTFYMENNRAMHSNRRMTARIYGYTILQLTAMFAIPFFVYKAFHNPGLPVIDMIAAQSFVTMISGYTPLPGAAGAAEGSFLIIFRLFFEDNVIQQAMLLWRLIAYYSCIIIGAFFAGIGDKREKYKISAEEKPEEDSKEEIKKEWEAEPKGEPNE